MTIPADLHIWNQVAAAADDLVDAVTDAAATVRPVIEQLIRAGIDPEGCRVAVDAVSALLAAADNMTAQLDNVTQ